MATERWLVITVNAPSDAQRDALAEGLLTLGGSAIEESSSALITYVPAPENLDAWLADAYNRLRDVSGEPVDLEVRWQDNEDWSESWKRGLRPRRVGRTFIVTPSWAEPELRAEDRVIVVDPEMAFGTGEHATTRGALRSLEQITRPGDRVLDVGTGSAILAIGAAMLGAQRVIAIDNDPDAILNARDNVQRNGVAERIELAEGLVDQAYLRGFGANYFDVIVANVLSSVLTPLLADFHAALRPGGHLIMGGILESEADDMIEACEAAGLVLLTEDLEAEWWGVLLRKPGAS